MCVSCIFFSDSKKKRNKAKYKIHEREETKKMWERHTQSHIHSNLCLRHRRYERNPRERLWEEQKKRKKENTFCYSKCRIRRFVIYDMFFFNKIIIIIIIQMRKR